MLLKLLITAFVILSGNNGMHEFHVSKCQVEYSNEDEALQVTMHIYIDDLEDALRKRGADKLFLCSEKENIKANEYLIDYLRGHFKLAVNNKPSDFVFIGKEPSEDQLAAWCYLEFPNIKNIKSITIENDILMDLYEDQKNIISVLVPNQQQGYFLFEKGKSAETMQF